MAAPVVSTVAGDHLGERFVLDRASEIQCLEIVHGPIVLCKTGVPTGEFLARVEGPALGVVVVELEYVVKHHGLGGADPAHPVNVDHTAAFEVGGAAEPFGVCQRAEPLLTIEKVLADAGGLFVMAGAAEEPASIRKDFLYRQEGLGSLAHAKWLCRTADLKRGGMIDIHRVRGICSSKTVMLDDIFQLNHYH